MKEEKKNDILKIVILINITTILSIKVLSFFKARDDFPGLLIILANICFIVGITNAIKNRSYLKYSYSISFLYFTIFLYYLINYTPDFLLLETILIIIYSVYYLLIRNKLKEKVTTATLEEKGNTDKLMIYFLIALISLIFAVYKVFLKIDSYYENKRSMQEYEKNKIENHLKWVEEMTYHLDNLSTNHYITATYLSKNSNSSFHNYLKVSEIKNSEVKLIKFRAPGYDLVPRLLEESYIKDAKKDTITLTIDKLKKTIFKDIQIRENIYNYQDSIKKEGVFYLIEDVSYINGPFLSKYEDLTYSNGDTLLFSFKNLNKKAVLKKIINVSGDAKWSNELPITVNSFVLNSQDYNRNAKFELEATNVNLEEDFKFELHFEDSEKNKHVFLINKNYSSYECKRIFD